MPTTALTLADQFRISRGEPVLVDQTAVMCVYRLAITGPSVLGIRRVRATSPRPQALRIAGAVDMTVNGVTTRDLVLRSETAPTRSDVVVHAVDATSLYIWNTWSVRGVDQAWLANAGMVAEIDLVNNPTTVRLCCSDGIGPPNFDDLVVEVTSEVWDPTAWDADADDLYGDWPITGPAPGSTVSN